MKFYSKIDVDLLEHSYLFDYFFAFQYYITYYFI